MKVLVTGGGGFLGGRIVELLLQEGHEVTFLARGRYPAVEARGARGLQVDLRDAAALTEAFRGQQAVLHVAAKAGFWGPRQEFVTINLEGTRNVIAACRANGVERLIYTSTPSVIGYAHEVNGLGHAPYPDRWESAYGETKARAEREVLAAHGPDLRTVALRPHLVIGPGDNHLLPRVVGRAREGRLFIVGDGKNLVDITYVDNAAWAHLDALRALDDPRAACGGKAYFLSNNEPVVLWDWVNALLVQLAIPPLQRKISLGTAQTLGLAMEWAWTLLPLPGEPRMTRFLAAALARSHWYDMKPAQQDFGYTIRVPLDEGTRRTVEWLHQAGLGGSPTAGR